MKSIVKLMSLAIALGFLFVTAQTAQAGDILCKVAVGSGALAEAVVSVEGVKGEFDPPTKHAVIDQKDKTFIPYVTAVIVGAVVEFGNSDNFLHNTYSRSKVATFNFNQPKRGSRSLLKTTKPGIIEVRCHIHQHMQAWVAVLDNPYFGVSNSKGLLKIEDVPAGTYTIKAWHPKHGTLTRKITVPAKGNAPVIFKYAK